MSVCDLLPMKFMKYCGPSELILLCVGAFTCIFTLIACILLSRAVIRHQRDTKRSKKRVKSIHTRCTQCTVPSMTTFLAITFYFSSSIIYILAVGRLNAHSMDNLQHDGSLVLYDLLFVCFLIMARLSMYTTFLSRIQIAFKGSTFQLSTTNIAMPITLFTLILVVTVWWIILMIHRYMKMQYEFPSYRIQLVVMTQLLLVMDASAWWVVIATMIHKLLQTMTLSDRSEVISRMKYFAPNLVMNPVTSSQVLPQVLPEPILEDKSVNIFTPKKPMNAAVSPDSVPDLVLQIESNESSLSISGGVCELAVLQNKGTVRTSRVSSEASNCSTNQSMHKRTWSEKSDTIRLELDLAFSALDKKDDPLLQLVTKHLLLGLLSMMTSQVCYISVITASILLLKEKHFDQHILMMMLFGILYPLEVVLNVATLYLTHKIGKASYEKVCGGCHSWCRVRCVDWMAAQQIRKQFPEQIGRAGNGITLSDNEVTL